MRVGVQDCAILVLARQSAEAELARPDDKTSPRFGIVLQFQDPERGAHHIDNFMVSAP